MKNRKEYPIFTGCIKYFPDALMEVSHVSFIANEQHNKGEPVHWSKGKSDDHEDAGLRHLIDVAKGDEVDDDELLHRAKICWRSLASLQIYIESQRK